MWAYYLFYIAAGVGLVLGLALPRPALVAVASLTLALTVWIIGLVLDAFDNLEGGGPSALAAYLILWAIEVIFLLPSSFVRRRLVS